ncbi:uncharacterized protein HD556DRAFT_1308745 [Suillus plorans]|uniref:Uncharacterized protein n=1 Tax=Suillus plorans TaxID=116603 RepID=A0A9P7DHT6_9AGAM|nr:uncharacterized protein HD556DRAFT_1308745 [Suillus plorans]KAG1793316.1 hypothetical protein HD556DRAFT_1308745 [Suillus plorans]
MPLVTRSGHRTKAPPPPDYVRTYASKDQKAAKSDADDNQASTRTMRKQTRSRAGPESVMNTQTQDRLHPRPKARPLPRSERSDPMTSSAEEDIFFSNFSKRSSLGRKKRSDVNEGPEVQLSDTADRSTNGTDGDVPSAGLEEDGTSNAANEDSVLSDSECGGATATNEGERSDGECSGAAATDEGERSDGECGGVAATNEGERDADKVPDQKVLEDLEAVCAVILEALQNPQPNTFVINDVTPAEYAVTLAFILEEPDCGIRAKFNYFQDMQELQIMAPLPIHKQPTTHLFKAITRYTDTIPYDIRLIDNNEDDDEAEIEIPRPIIKWVGECRLSSDDNSMIRKLRLMTDSSRETEYALMISLRERSQWQQPKDNSLASKVLRASPTMDYEDFIPCHIKRSLRFGPVIIQSHVWIDMCEVRYTVFKCGADSHFDFNSKNVQTFAEGTIYPEIKMGDIEHILSEAAKSLKEYIISLMEGMGLEEPAIQSVRESHPV